MFGQVFLYKHLTLKIPDTETFLINPFGLRYNEIQPKNISSGDSIIKIPKKVFVHTRKQFEYGAANGGAEVRHPEWPVF